MRLADLRSELRQLLSGRVGIADGVMPPLVFVTVNQLWGVPEAAVFGIGAALAITGWRLMKGRPARFASAGLLGTVLAALLALRTGASEDFYLPGIVSGALTTLLIVVLNLVRRPFVAWTSWLARGWPLRWYWHPQVRPAYSRAGWLWAAFFATRTLLQWRLYLDQETTALGLARVIMGWPALLILLVLTYGLGRRWLVALLGPSVEEYEASVPPPWKGQLTAF